MLILGAFLSFSIDLQTWSHDEGLQGNIASFLRSCKQKNRCCKSLNIQQLKLKKAGSMMVNESPVKVQF